MNSDMFTRDRLLAGAAPITTRRQMLQRTGMGMGLLALQTLIGTTMGRQAGAVEATAGSFAPKSPPFAARAKHVIHILAGGGPSQVDTWDPKPLLMKNDGKAIPGYHGVAFGSPFKFKKMGQSGIEVSEVFSKIGEHVDEMALIRTMTTDIPVHEVAQRFLFTGSLQLPKPSLGSWVVYGLGYENQNLPAFITLGGNPEWRQASFLPGITQGANVNYRQGMPLDEILLNIRNPFESAGQQRRQLDVARKLNALYNEDLQQDPQIEARIASFEMAFKMQTEATEAFDIEKEPKATRELYGSGLGLKLLAARRLVERGVRFVQVPAGSWDHHSELERNLPKAAAETDAPVAALLTDLKRRGLLDETLVIWCGEFGRTADAEIGPNVKPGRNHNGRAGACWMAGGGVKAGTVHGATDEFGGHTVENPVHIHDLHATILRLLGFDHEKLTYRYNGRDFRLTDNFGKVVSGVIA
jgi:hypothetical protein